MDFSKFLTALQPCCIFLCSLPPSVHTGEAKSQASMTPFPTLQPMPLSLPLLQQHLCRPLIPQSYPTLKYYCTDSECLFPPVIAKVPATVGLAMKSNSARSQIANSSIVKDAWLRQQRMMGTQELPHLNPLH